MSHENVDAFKRGLHTYNRRHIDALLDELDPDVEWHPALAVVLGGEQTVFHGHRGVRDSIREEDEALAEYQVEISEIRTSETGSSRSDVPASGGRGVERRSNLPFHSDRQ
jgi:hypothetical protein